MSAWWIHLRDKVTLAAHRKRQDLDFREMSAYLLYQFISGEAGHHHVREKDVDGMRLSSGRILRAGW